MTKAIQQFVFALTITIAFSFTAEARKNKPHQGDRPSDQWEQVDGQAADADVVRAVRGHKRVHFVEGAGMIVTRILPDDTHGLEHQKWYVRLSNGQEIQAVYNLDMCPRVPVRVGDEVSLAGMYIPTGKTGLIHWLHHDPKGRRPDGYVKLNGTYYCKD